MAQATQDFQRRVAAQQQKVRTRVAETNAARAARPPSLSAGLEVGTATQAEFDAARARAAAARANAPAPVPQAGAVRASALTPDEAASFNRQTGGRFQQAFPSAPTVDNARARTNAGAAPTPRPTATIADDLVRSQPAGTSRAFSAGEAVGQRVGQVLRNPGVQRAGRVAGRVAAPVGVLAEGMDVARVAADENSSGLDVAEQAARSTGKVAGGAAGAIAGAKLGAGLGTLVTPGIGTAIGGGIGALAGGYFGAEGVDKAIDFFTGDDDPIAATNARDAAAGTQAGKPDFSNVVGGSRTVQGLAPPGAAERQAANDGITPVGDRVGNPDEVLGTFNGRAITRAESDRLSGGSSGLVAPQRASLGDGLASPATGGSVSAGSVGGGAEDRLRDINDSSTPAGKLYAALAQDKTPTGKRMAAQFLETYLGTGTQERGQNAGLQADQLNANASLLRGREGDASNERAVAASARARPQYQIGEDGSILQLSDGVATTVRGEDGQPARAGTRGGNPIEGLKQQEELIGMRVGKPEDYASVEEYQAARQQALAQLMTELGIGVAPDGP